VIAPETETKRVDRKLTSIPAAEVVARWRLVGVDEGVLSRLKAHSRELSSSSQWSRRVTGASLKTMGVTPSVDCRHSALERREQSGDQDKIRALVFLPTLNLTWFRGREGIADPRSSTKSPAFAVASAADVKP
jgi:hypothetical protein